MRRLAIFLATAGYSGYFPFAPGTVGSAVGLVLFAALRWFATPLAEVAAVVAISLAGVWAAHEAELHWGRRDPGAIVIDEVAGMLVTLLAVPVSWAGALLGFLLFRAYDIAKPFGARQFERLPGGYGVMADDLVAGLYANLTLRAALWLLPALSA
ncbi:MAG TPA: phosphatidylglycerophosphatase A [Vicinamibacterales bacterium]|jgi:phosphatidylglycerophosphatase A|nr:phosphatidylglycerophosphatase A [Acidobacteriota bacterium]HOC17226.1 phosphatidylglycerophosphatase A [Vicinamibacterales bacterium]